MKLNLTENQIKMILSTLIFSSSSDFCADVFNDDELLELIRNISDQSSVTDLTDSNVYLFEQTNYDNKYIVKELEKILILRKS